MNGPLPVRIVSSAARAIVEATQWWKSNRPKAPGAFVDELERRFSLLPRSLPLRTLIMSDLPESDACD